MFGVTVKDTTEQNLKSHFTTAARDASALMIGASPLGTASNDDLDIPTT